MQINSPTPLFATQFSVSEISFISLSKASPRPRARALKANPRLILFGLLIVLLIVGYTKGKSVSGLSRPILGSALNLD